MKIRRAVSGLIASALLLLVACQSPASTQGQVPAADGSKPRTLTSVSMLRNMFNRDDGRVRLILLLSPT